MAFFRAVTALAASAALSTPMLVSSAFGLTASRAKTAVSPSLGSTTTPASSLEAYTGADLLSSPWIRTSSPVAQSMLHSAPWTRSGPAGLGDPLAPSCTAKTGSPTAGMMASCMTGRYPVERGLESGGVPFSATRLVCPYLSSPEEEEEEEGQDGGETTVIVDGMLGTAPWTKNVQDRTELSAASQVRCQRVIFCMRMYLQPVKARRCGKACLRDLEPRRTYIMPRRGRMHT